MNTRPLRPGSLAARIAEKDQAERAMDAWLRRVTAPGR